MKWVEDWDNQVQWIRRFASVFRVLAPNVRLHLPALSPHGNYLDGHIVYLREDLADYFDMVDVHAYCMADLTDAPALAHVWDKPVCVTEINSVNPIDYMDYLNQYPECDGAYWFILSGEVGGGEDQRQHWLMGSQYYDAFKTAGQGIGHEIPETPTDGAISGPYDGPEGENMDEATRNELWNDYMAFPAFERFRAAHPELGDELEDRERNYGIYRVKFFAGGVIGAKVGDWDNITIWTAKEDLPPLS